MKWLWIYVVVLIICELVFSIHMKWSGWNSAAVWLRREGCCNQEGWLMPWHSPLVLCDVVVQQGRNWVGYSVPWGHFQGSQGRWIHWLFSDWFQWNLHRRVLETTVKAVNLFIVPRFFVVSKIADPDGLEWFSIISTPKWVFLILLLYTLFTVYVSSSSSCYRFHCRSNHPFDILFIAYIDWIFCLSFRVRNLLNFNWHRAPIIIHKLKIADPNILARNLYLVGKWKLN